MGDSITKEELTEILKKIIARRVSERVIRNHSITNKENYHRYGERYKLLDYGGAREFITKWQKVFEEALRSAQCQTKGGIREGYWDATDNIKKRLGGKNPICPIHKKEMTPQDDHGRFICWECGLNKTHDLGEEERGFTIRKIGK